MTNEIQTLSFSPTPTGGTFTVSFPANSSTTAAIDWNAILSDVQTAVDGALGAGNCTVNGSISGGLTFTYGGTYAGTNVGQLTCDASALVAADNAISVTTTTFYSAGQNQIDTLSFSPAPDGGDFSIIFGAAGSTATIAWNAATATIQTIVDAVLGAGNCVVGGDIVDGLTFEYTGSLACTAVTQLTCGDADLTGLMTTPTLSVSEITAGLAAYGQPDVWSLNFTQGDGSGNFQIGQPSGGSATIFSNYAASDVQAAIQATWPSSVVSVVDSGGGVTPYTITLTDGEYDFYAIDDNPGDDSDPNPSIVESQGWVAPGYSIPATAEVMQISASPTPSSGQYSVGSGTCLFDDSGMGNDTLQEAMNGFTGYSATVTGGPLSSGIPFTITWSSTGVPPLKLSDATANFGTPNVINISLLNDGPPVATPGTSQSAIATTYQQDTIQLDINASGGYWELGGTESIAEDDDGTGVQSAYNTWATSNSWPAATIVKTGAGVYTVTYAIAGDQTAVTAALQAVTFGDTLTQAVVATPGTSQDGSSGSFIPAWAQGSNIFLGV